MCIRDSFNTGAPATITTTSPLASWPVNVTSSQALAATGGTSPYKWAMVQGSGSLPTGLSLGTTGVINGTPTTAGSSTFTVQVTDSSTPAQTATKALTLGVLAIAPSTLPNPTQGVSYSQTLSVTGGAPSYSWTAPQTGLPPGINFVAALPGFTGTPTAAGTYTFTVGVTDSTGGSATQQYSATVQAPLTMTTASLPGGTQQAPYSQVVAASGGQAPYTWSIAASSWVGPYPPYQLTPTKPQWSINNSGTLTATPTLFGTYLVTVQVTDSLASTATRQFSINVQPASTTDLAPLKGFEYFPRGHAWWSVFYDWYTNDCDTNTAHIYAQGDCLAGTVSDAVQADLQTLHNAGFNYVHLYPVSYTHLRCPRPLGEPR